MDLQQQHEVRNAIQCGKYLIWRSRTLLNRAVVSPDLMECLSLLENCLYRIDSATRPSALDCMEESNNDVI